MKNDAQYGEMDREQYELMTQCPGITDMDPEAQDKDYDRAMYEGSLGADCAEAMSKKTITEMCMDLAVMEQELIALRATPEPPNIFEVARRRTIQDEIDHVASFYARK